MVETKFQIAERMGDLIVHHLRDKDSCTVDDLRYAGFSDEVIADRLPAAVALASVTLGIEVTVN